MRVAILFTVLFCGWAVVGQTVNETLNDRIQAVFGTALNNNSISDESAALLDERVGFDVIVEPEPLVEPTTAPQILTTGRGENCTCIEYYMCDPNRSAVRTDVQQDFGIIDIRFNPNECVDVLDVCCVAAQIRREPANPPSVTARPNTPRGCGIRNVGGLDFQLAGNTNEAGFGEFPWTVALLRIADEACLCGGSLIHPQVILTANHCVRQIRPNDIKIRAGEWDTQTTKERLPYQERTVIQTISHPSYNSKTLANDIALLIVDTPFVLDDHINSVCLPRQGLISTGAMGIASGWGKDVFGKQGKYSVIQKLVELPVVDSQVCQLALQRTRLGPRFRLDNSFICAGGEPGKDTCQGDGGAPLVCPTGNNNRYEQCGIVSWGIGCKESRPAVYADVAGFRNWIDGQMNTFGFGTASYTYI